MMSRFRTDVFLGNCKREEQLRKEIQENIRIEEDENETPQNRESARDKNSGDNGEIAALHENN